MGRAAQRTAASASKAHRDSRPLMSIPETAAHLGKSRATVYRLIHSGHLRTVQVGATLRVRPSDLDDYLDRNIVS